MYKVLFSVKCNYSVIIVVNFSHYYFFSLVAQMIKKPPTMREIWVLFLGWENPLEEGKTTHSSILAWKIPWTEEPVWLQSMGSQRIRHD